MIREDGLVLTHTPELYIPAVEDGGPYKSPAEFRQLLAVATEQHRMHMDYVHQLDEKAKVDMEEERMADIMQMLPNMVVWGSPNPNGAVSGANLMSAPRGESSLNGSGRHSPQRKS